MLICFHKASGNEVKLAKSFVIWLGPWKGITDHIFGTHPLIGSERPIHDQLSSHTCQQKRNRKIMKSSDSEDLLPGA